MINSLKDYEIYLYGPVSNTAGDGVISVEYVKKELEAAGGADLILYVNSPGGDVYAGQTISELIARYKGKKTCIIDGLCASIATKIPMVSDEVIFATGAYFMIHRASCGCEGNADNMLKTAEFLEKVDEGLANAYVSKAKVTKERIKELMNQETWFNSTDVSEIFDFFIGNETRRAVACADKNILNTYRNTPDELLKQETAILELNLL